MDVHEFAAKADDTAKDCGRAVATDLMLRAIFLKINSKEAHELLHTQILDQVRYIKEAWVAQERAKYLKTPIGNLSDEEYAASLDESFNRIEKYAKSMVDAVFQGPQDIAGVL